MDLKPVEAGKLLSADWLNRLLEAVQRGARITVNGPAHSGDDFGAVQITIDPPERPWLMQTIADTVDYDSSLTADTIRAFIAQRVIANSDGTYSLLDDEKFQVYDPLRLLVIFDNDSDTTHAIPYQQFYAAVNSGTGNREVVSVQHRQRWLKCTTKWQYQGVPSSGAYWIDGYACDDCSGTNVDTNTTLRVVFTPDSAHSNRQPNVVTNDIIPFENTHDPNTLGVSGFPFATAGYLFDDPVATVRFMVSAGGPPTMPKGWALMNGTDNSGANGGSGVDMMTDNPFLRTGGSGSGGSVGALAHTHTITTTNLSNVAVTGAATGIATVTSPTGSTDATPNWIALYPIERLNNGQAA